MVDFEADVFPESGAVGGVGRFAANEFATRPRWAYRMVVGSLLAVEAAWVGGLAALVWWAIR